MKDKEFLQWLHSRLVNRYGIDSATDYLHKLRAIIAVIPEDQNTSWLVETFSNPPDLKQPNYFY